MDKSKIKLLADYAVRQCCDNSDNCYWSVSYDELYHHFGVEITDSNESAKQLEKELRQREEINELIMTEDAIEMTCHLRYCPQCQGDPLSLFSALGCNSVISMTTTKPNTTMSLRTIPPMRMKRRLCLCKGEHNIPLRLSDHLCGGVRRLDVRRCVHDMLCDQPRAGCQLQHRFGFHDRPDKRIHLVIRRPILSHKAVVPTGIFVPEVLVFLHLCHSLRC